MFIWKFPLNFWWYAFSFVSGKSAESFRTFQAPFVLHKILSRLAVHLELSETTRSRILHECVVCLHVLSANTCTCVFLKSQELNKIQTIPSPLKWQVTHTHSMQREKCSHLLCCAQYTDVALMSDYQITLYVVRKIKWLTQQWVSNATSMTEIASKPSKLAVEAFSWSQQAQKRLHDITTSTFSRYLECSSSRSRTQQCRLERCIFMKRKLNLESLGSSHPQPSKPHPSLLETINTKFASLNSF